MDCPIDIPVYEKNKAVGKLHIRHEGLYYVFSCRLALQSSRILRLYVLSGFSCVPVGVLMPTKDGLMLEHKVSVNSWKLNAIDTALCGFPPEPDYLPWRGVLGGTEVCGWIKEENDRYLFAADVSEEPFPLIENLADAEPCTLSGIDCMRLRISRTGEILTDAGQIQSNEKHGENQESSAK